MYFVQWIKEIVSQPSLMSELNLAMMELAEPVVEIGAQGFWV